MTSQQPSVSVRVRLDVGSSRISSRASSDSALAISTICCCASESSATGVSGEKSTPSRSRSAGPGAQGSPVDQPQRAARGGLAADADVGGDVEVVEKVEFLVDEGDAGRLVAGRPSAPCAGRRRCGSCPGRLDHAAQNLHQGRLAGAVFADQAHDFAARRRPGRSRPAPLRRDRSCDVRRARGTVPPWLSRARTARARCAGSRDPREPAAGARARLELA